MKTHNLQPTKCERCGEEMYSSLPHCAKCHRELWQTETVRCPDHRNGGVTRCPRGGADLQIWQRRQWGD